jgi:predicted dehydrogenase
MTDRINFAFIGCGEISVQSSDSILESRRCRLVHCMDIRGELAEDLAARHDARHTTNLDDVLGDDEVQAVVIPTPHWQHAPLSIAAAEAGKHVLVEKPIACTLDEADAMIASADAAGVILGVFHPQRLGFAQEKARELVAAGAIGQVAAYKIHNVSCKPAHYWHGGYTGRVTDDWRIPLATSGGGYLIMNEIHNLDSMVSILDPAPRRIYAEYGTFNTPVEVEDFISFVMRLDGGAIVSLDGASAAPGAESHGDRVYGTKGQIAIGNSCRVYLDEPVGDLAAGEWVELRPPEGYPNSRTAYLDAFAEAVATGGQPPVTGREGRRAFEIVRGAYLSMHRGAPVEFPVSEQPH